MIIGYARVSTDGQTLDAQCAALTAAGAAQVFAEKVSCAVTDRKAQITVGRVSRRWALGMCCGHAAGSAGPDDPGPPQRLGRGRQGWCGVRVPRGCLCRHEFTARAVDVTVLGGLAEFERELIRARTDEGRNRAQARGVRFGRKLKLTPYQRQEALARRAQCEPLVEIARTFGVSHSTISRLPGRIPSSKG